MTENVIPGDNFALKTDHSSVRYAVAVASGKGGVGKSTVAVNLAIAFKNQGWNVGLMDADIYGPNIPTMMGVEIMPEPTGLSITPAEAHGIKLVSMGFLVRPDQALIWRGPMLHNAIRQFVEGAAWGELDILVIDLPPGTGDAQLSLSQVLGLSGGLIVTLPQKVSIDDARRGLQMFRKMEVPILGIIENMSYLDLEDGSRMEVFGSGGGRALARENGLPLLTMLPMDPAVREGGDTGLPIILNAPESRFAESFRDLANQLIERLEQGEDVNPGLSIEMMD